MSAPMTDERRAEIREAARPGYADILAQLIKHGAHDDPEHGKVIVHGVTVVPAADLKAAVRVVWFGAPALLAEVERLRAELTQVTTATTYLQGPEECLERECEEYFDDHGNERPGVEYCSHLKAKRLTVDEHLAAQSERDDVVAELEEERLTGDALRKDRDQIHDELAAARAALAEERARHGELVAEMQRARLAAEDARAKAERHAVELEDARTDRKTAEMQRDDYRKAHKASVADADRLAKQVEKVSNWVTSDVVTACSEFGNGYREAMRDVRDLLNGGEAATS